MKYVPFFKKKPERMSADDLVTESVFTPPRDERFMKVLEGVHQGQIPLYLAEIPLRRISLFSEDFRPSGNIVEALTFDVRVAVESGEVKKLPKIFVYPDGDRYVSSDDYPLMLAYRALRTERVWCFVCGEPRGEGIDQVFGPAPLEDAQRIVTGG